MANGIKVEQLRHKPASNGSTAGLSPGTIFARARGRGFSWYGAFGTGLGASMWFFVSILHIARLIP